MLRLKINDGQDAAFAALMPEMVEATLKESGTKSYAWHRQGDEVHIFERYASSGDAMIHMDSFGANFAEKFLSAMTPTGLDVYGPAQDDLRAALSTVGAKFYGQVGGFDR